LKPTKQQVFDLIKRRIFEHRHLTNLTQPLEVTSFKIDNVDTFVR